MAQVAAQNLKDITEALRWARDGDRALEIFAGGSKRAIGRRLNMRTGFASKRSMAFYFTSPKSS